MRAIAWDTWAFLEVLLDEPRAGEVGALLDAADLVVTSREVIAETFSFLARRAGNAERSIRWWDAVREGSIVVAEPTLDEIRRALPRQDLGRLSFTDLSLAHVAKAEGIEEIATGDAEFERLGLTPLFAKAERRRRPR